MQRIKLYSQISTSLAALSNEKLKQILTDANNKSQNHHVTIVYQAQIYRGKIDKYQA